VTPTPAAGLTVAAFATGLDHPRWLYGRPNGDMLVAETNAPPSKGRRSFVQIAMGIVLKIVGAGVESPNRITLLRDADRDGIAETKSVFFRRAQFSIRHGADRPRSLLGRHRCPVALSL
jgi:glucose/arabinose dehydrogenase